MVETARDIRRISVWALLAAGICIAMIAFSVVPAYAGTVTGVLTKYSPHKASNSTGSTQVWITVYNTDGSTATRKYKASNAKTKWRIETQSGAIQTVKRNAFFARVKAGNDVCKVTWAWKTRDGKRYRYIKRIVSLVVNSEG